MEERDQRFQEIEFNRIAEVEERARKAEETEVCQMLPLLLRLPRLKTVHHTGKAPRGETPSEGTTCGANRSSSGEGISACDIEMMRKLAFTLGSLCPFGCSKSRRSKGQLSCRKGWRESGRRECEKGRRQSYVHKRLDDHRWDDNCSASDLVRELQIRKRHEQEHEEKIERAREKVVEKVRQ